MYETIQLLRKKIFQIDVKTQFDGNIIKGKLIAKEIRKIFKPIIEENKITPTLAVVNTQIDEASNYYVQSQKKIFSKFGLQVREICLSKEITQSDFIKKIEELNHDDSINGIQAQIPLPKHLDTQDILDRIAPEKDVDCQSSLSLGRLMSSNHNYFFPNTAFAVQVILSILKLDLSGLNTLIVNRSTVVGKPLSQMLLAKDSFSNANVTLIHSRTKNIEHYTRQADIIICAVGKSNFLDKSMIKKDVILIDVGINPVTIDGKETITGDIDFESVKDKCAHLTPVPGGVGSVTTSLLMMQTVWGCLIQKALKK